MKHADTSLRGKRLTAFTITIVLILTSIFTASSLFVLAQSRNGDDTPVIGTIPDGTSASTVTIRPALDDETLIGQTTSFWTLTPDVARDALTDAGLPASSDPVSQLTSMVKSTGDASLAMRILSGVYARVTDGSHDPVGVFKGEGSARIMDGTYFAAGSQGTMTVFHTPDTLYMAGLVDTGHVTEQDAVEQQQQLVTPDTTTDSADTTGDGVQAAPADTTADAVFTPAVFRSAPTGTARNTGYDNNDLRDSQFGIYPDPTLGAFGQTNTWSYGTTENGMRVVCIEGTKYGPDRVGEKYSAQTIVPNKTQLNGKAIRQDQFDHARNTLYWGYKGPGYKWAATLDGRQGKSELQEVMEGHFKFYDGKTTDGQLHSADWWENWFMSFTTHYVAVSIMNPDKVEAPTAMVNFYANGMPVRANDDHSWEAVFDWLTNAKTGRMLNNGQGDANHMELVLLRPADTDNQGHQLLLGWRYHNYNLTIRTQLYSSDPGNNNPKETTECSVKTVESDGRKTLVNQSNTNPDTHPCDSLTNTVHDAITVTNNGPTDKPNDHWTITWWLNVVEEDGTKHTVNGTLPVNDIIGVGQSNSKTYNTPSMTPGSFSSSMKPSANAKWTAWPKNAQIWYDVDLNANGTVYGTATSDGGAQTTNAAHHAATQQPGIDGTTDVTINDGKEAFVTPGTGLKLTTELRTDYGSNGNKTWDALKAPQLGKSQPVLDHLRINPTDSYLTGVRLDMKFTLKYSPAGYGKNVKASKTLDKTVPIIGTWLQGEDHETDSPQFTPSDLGMAVWKEGYYWFDVTVKRASVAAAPGLKADSYEHAGASDTNERFQLFSSGVHFTPSITSQTVDVNGKSLGNTTPLHDGTPSRDTLTATITSMERTNLSLPKLTLKAHGTLWWSNTPGTDGNKPADAKQISQLTPQNIAVSTCNKNAAGLMTCTGRTTYDPSKDPKLKGKLTGYGSGYYTYVWQLDKNDYTNMNTSIMVGNNIVSDSHSVVDLLRFPSNGVISDGWRPAREQTQQDAQWTLSLTKTACTGNISSACTWDKNQLIQGAKFNLTETDASWKTKKGGQTINFTTGKDGKATSGIQHIGSGETRYYTLTETSVPRPYAKPRNGVWHVTVTQTPGTKGARITMQATGDALQNGTPHAASGTLTANIATGVQNQAETWTAEIGNLRPISAMPPQTGWTHDAGRLLAIGIITTIVTGMGIAFALHRRHTHATNMGRHEA